MAFIPGEAAGGAFVQVIGKGFSRFFSFPSLIAGREIRVGDCVFGSLGCRIALPDITGSIGYGPLTPLKSDIMGPFRFLPLQCRHGVVSMTHELSGCLEAEGRHIDFSNGRGYIEQDSGRSFPKSYLWLQCNDFPVNSSVMVSVAHIPLAGFSFTGCICALLHEGREYRLATYRGVKIIRAGPRGVELAQGKLRLAIDIQGGAGLPLQAPWQGRMVDTIRECNSVRARCRLWQQGRLIMDLESGNAGFEYVE